MLVLFYPSVIPSLFSFGFVFVVLKCWALDPVFPISRTVQVRYGYFAEPRPVHVACARGWMDMYDDITETYYEVSCYPQSSGRFAAARLDSGELHLAHLGSAPLAEALARGLRLVLLYITQYAGDSQGMYVRPGSNITNPLDLVDKTIGVPFGSTMHYQVLFLVNLFGLKGKVRLLDLSPSEIIKAWDEGRIDIGACWGIARDYLLKLGGAGNPDIDPATPLVSAKVISDWGRETFTMLVADEKFTDEHPRFITYVTAVLSRLNDSYLDRLGLIDPKNAERWSATDPSSFTASMVDALMIVDEIPGNPSENQRFSQREALDAFVQPSAIEQVSCAHLGTVEFYKGGSLTNLSTNTITCESVVSPIRRALMTTAEFLFDQKIISDYTDAFEPSVGMPDGVFLAKGYDFSCTSDNFSNCLPVGKYAQYGIFLDTSDNEAARNSTGNMFDLLNTLEDMDLLFDVELPGEVGRVEGNSNCQIDWPSAIGGNQSITGSISDAGGPGLTYSDGINCWVAIHAVDCANESSPCMGNVRVDVESFRVWSGDFLRVFADPTRKSCDKNDRGDMVLLAQWSGIHYVSSGSTSPFPPLVAKGCLLIQFTSDGNAERSFRDSENKGNGFRLLYNRDGEGCLEDVDCNDFPCGIEADDIGLCQCGGSHWGADCSIVNHCLGTQRLKVALGETTMISSSVDFHQDSIADNDSAKKTFYPNNLDCIWELELMNVHTEAKSPEDIGPIPSITRTISSYAVVSGTSGTHGGAQVFFVPLDSDGRASLRLVTDFLGERGGFIAYVTLSKETSRLCSDAGTSGIQCESDHCLPNNRFSPPSKKTESLDEGQVLGRVVSQIGDSTTASFPSSSCSWPFTALDPSVAIRLMFASPLSLEPRPAYENGDSLVVSVNMESDGGSTLSTFIFVKECVDDGETCGSFWQTGNCVEGKCEVKTTFDIQLPETNDNVKGEILLHTDRNDYGMDYKGVDFDLLLVQACPASDGTHCRSLKNGNCVDGYCICNGGIPCNCSCEGSPPFVTTNLSILLGVLVPVCLVFAGIFCWYRRRKNHRSRAQKAIIAAKEAELDAFRESIVGMRTASTEYIPLADKAEVERLQSSTLFVSSEGQCVPQVMWCWQETSDRVQLHDPDEIVGDPAGGFIRYSAHATTKLETAFEHQNERGVCSPIPGYTVNFEKMVQTKDSTGFRRIVKRVPGSRPKDQSSDEHLKLSEFIFSGSFCSERPFDLASEPQMVLVKGDIIQITTTRGDGWAFGTKLYHADEAAARRLLSISTEKLANKDDPNVFIDTGWFPLQATLIPSKDDMKILKANVGDSKTLEPPKHWELVEDPTAVNIYNLHASSEEFKKVAEAFLSTLKPPTFEKKPKILAIQRVQNLAMYQSYVVKRQTICYRETCLHDSSKTTAEVEARQKRALRRFERRWLWHGTNREVLDKILAQGFNRSFAGKNATMYGKGVYFARDASYSAYERYSTPDNQGTQYMLACRVVVGEYCLGKKDALTPDVRPGSDNMLFDSTVGLPMKGDTMARPSIFVTYHDAQAYPEYIIKFRLQDKSFLTKK
ncbi:taurine ABC transporter periplasmic ligand binding protein [Nitzschia inconspicua]|uniref:Poly [ADP-ribose] polymerase n=1 Tax=Nitzschia inconspicua TaxID=303405 RepID=A0A9K3LL16_9STRA|nr:taurine ABC transporter periplasmic ligand binding protein [Nitzschia inconspicua]